MTQLIDVEKSKKIPEIIKKWFIISIIFLCFLLGCSNTPDNNKRIERVKLELSDPSPITTKKVNWVVITANNYQEVFQELKDKNYDIILIGLTDKDYENLSLNMAEIKRYILEQQVIISSYKEYYEGTNHEKTQEIKEEK